MAAAGERNNLVGDRLLVKDHGKVTMISIGSEQCGMERKNPKDSHSRERGAGGHYRAQTHHYIRAPGPEYKHIMSLEFNVMSLLPCPSSQLQTDPDISFHLLSIVSVEPLGRFVQGKATVAQRS